MSEAKTGLALLREDFPTHQISKLPKPSKQQTEAVKANFKAGIRCTVCSAWHHPDVVHLDYVGHAALTDRLLDADPGWTWEPLAMGDGVPVMDNLGGMWIKLTVCGVMRLGYGHAGDKTGGDAIKEVIGDALRNAAMRFGAALYLWHKGDLHIDEEPKSKPEPTPETKKSAKEDTFDAKRVANNLKTGIAAGDASGAASYLAGLEAAHLDAVWVLLDEKHQDALTAAWPAEGTE